MFSVGYQLPDEGGERFPEIVADYRDAVAEVYFAPGDAPSARTPSADASGYAPEDAEAILQEDLAALRGMGVKLNLLCNANCYGGAAVSKTLAATAASAIARYRPDSVTTTSIFLADRIRKGFPGLGVRASVNMNLASVEELAYVADFFDSYCVSRELNYDLGTLDRIGAWARANGKSLVVLANSGCLRNCPAHAFHDNLVAHFAEIDPADVETDFQPVFCRSFYASPENRAGFLEHASFLRPENVAEYARFAPLVKLATRTHPNPRLVIDAYSRGRFTGNLFDLTEPNHGQRFKGKVLDAARIDDAWWRTKARCSRDCASCGLCRKVLAGALVDCEVLEGSCPWTQAADGEPLSFQPPHPQQQPSHAKRP